MSYEIILWNLDGTIADTESLMKHSIEKVLSSKGENQDLVNEYTPKNSPYSFFKECGLNPKECMGIYWRAFTKNIDDYVELYYPIKEVLSTLHNNDKEMAIVSSLPDQMISSILHMEDISHFFSTIVGYHDTENNKPHPDPINEALDRIDIQEKKDTIYIGDSPNDQKAAENANIDFYWASWGYFSDGELSKLPNILNSPDEIIEYLS